MSSTRLQAEGGTEVGKASPDWIQTSTSTENVETGSGQSDDHLVELKYRSVENLASAKFARGLGMFSIALGLAEVLAPGKLGELVGLNDRYSSYLPLFGAREIASGLGIMRGEKPTAAVWSRVGGDVIDLAFLGAAMADSKADRSRLGMAAAAVAGVTVLDILCAKKLSQPWTESNKNPFAPTTVGQPSARQAVA